MKAESTRRVHQEICVDPDRLMAKKKLKSKSQPRANSNRAKPHSRAKRALTRHAAATAALQYVPWTSVPLEDLNPLLQRQFVVGQEIMLARVLLKKGCIVPEHSHHNEIGRAHV